MKPFDVSLEWLAKYRNQKSAAFWFADDDEMRMEQIKTARNGGSITSEFDKKLKKHISDGRVSLHTHTTIMSQVYDTKTDTWSLMTEPPIPGLPPIDYIYYATGIQSNFEEIPLLKTLCEKFPIECVGGLPAITDDLMWSKDVPLFVTGRLASLRIGPGAANLEGARIGAERIAWSYQDLSNQVDIVDEAGEEDDRSHSDEWEDFCTGRGNRFASLSIDFDVKD